MQQYLRAEEAFLQTCPVLTYKKDIGLALHLPATVSLLLSLRQTLSGSSTLTDDDGDHDPRKLTSAKAVSGAACHAPSGAFASNQNGSWEAPLLDAAG